ncbi:hypothetical protein [Thalassotalea fusca]
MLDKLKHVVLTLLIALAYVNQAHAGLIVYTDRAAFEEALNSPMAFEGFNEIDLVNSDFSSISGYIGSRTGNSLVSEGERALVAYEQETLSIGFNHDVFAFGFDINELNATNLTYTDNAGHTIIDALEITEVWNESSFFGVISDIAITSFSLAGQRGGGAVYGFDALTYTASAVEVPTPATWILLLAGVFGLIVTRQK